MFVSAKIKVQEFLLKFGSRHNKIFIIPTSYGLYFIAIVFILFLISLSYGHSLAFTTTFVFVSLVMTSAHFTNYNLAGVEVIAIHCPDETFAEQDAPFKVTLRNNTKKHRFDLVLKVGGKGESEAFSIGPGQTISQLLILKNLERGEYHLKRITIGSSFPFGLFYAWKYWYGTQTFMVFPKISKDKLRLPEPQSDSQQRGAEGGSPEVGAEEFFGHQTYDAGMPLRAIDWKAYARGKGLYLKKFIEESDINYIIKKSDIKAEEGKGEDSILEALTTLILEVDSVGARYAVILQDEGPQFGKGKLFKKENLKRLATFNRDRQVLL